MKKITFYGPSPSERTAEEPKTIRTGTRAIIEKDGTILFSYLGKRHQYLLPGGGMKKGETPKTNAIREVQEECGLIIEPQEPFLVIDEHYGNFMYRDYYCKATITGTTATNYDEGEIKLGLEPRWLDMETILKELTTFEITPVDLVGAQNHRLLVTYNSHYRESLAISLLYNERIPAIPQNIKNRTLARVEYTEG